MLFSTLLAFAPLALAAPLVERATNISGSPTGFKQPPARGWSDATDSYSPCGGKALGNRTTFPLSGGQISILSYVDGDDLQFRYSTSSNPTNNSDFHDLLPQIPAVYGGHHCYAAPDFATSFGLAAGQNVTLQVVYECADVTLVETANWVAPEGYYCINGSLSTATVDTNNYTDAAPAKSGSVPLARVSSASVTTGLLAVFAGVAITFA
ncbi:hypothetical protein T439DRAFT_383913 [Meredithblackwellia eburnea MCA 4105]